MSGSVFFSGGGEIGGPVGNVVTGYSTVRNAAGTPPTSDGWVALFFRVTDNTTPDYRILFQLVDSTTGDGNELGLFSDGLTLAYFTTDSGGSPSISTGESIVLGEWYFASFAISNSVANLWWKRAGAAACRRGIPHSPVTGFAPQAFSIGTEFEIDNTKQLGVTGNICGVRYWVGVRPSDADVEAESRSLRARRRVGLWEEWPLTHPKDVVGRVRGTILVPNNTATIAQGGSPTIPEFPRFPKFPVSSGAVNATATGAGVQATIRAATAASAASAVAGVAAVRSSSRAALSGPSGAAAASSAGVRAATRLATSTVAGSSSAAVAGGSSGVRAAVSTPAGSGAATGAGSQAVTRLAAGGPAASARAAGGGSQGSVRAAASTPASSASTSGVGARANAIAASAAPAAASVASGAGSRASIREAELQSPPTIASITPAIGLASGDQMITLTGARFRPAVPVALHPEPYSFTTWPQTATVLFDGVPSPEVRVLSDSTVTALLPPGDPGDPAQFPTGRPVSVTLINLDQATGAPISGESVTVANGFIYQRPIHTNDYEGDLSRAMRELLRRIKRQFLAVEVNYAVQTDYDADTGDELHVTKFARLPGVVLVGPELVENRFYSLNEEPDVDDGSVSPLDGTPGGFLEARVPYTVDVSFDVIAASDNKGEYLNMMANFIMFMHKNKWLYLDRSPTDPSRGKVRYEMDFAADGQPKSTTTVNNSNVRSWSAKIMIRGFDIEAFSGIRDGTLDPNQVMASHAAVRRGTTADEVRLVPTDRLAINSNPGE